VQIAREKMAGSIFFTAHVDGKLVKWAAGPTKGEVAAFESAVEAEREALYALAVRYLDAAAWQALQQLEAGDAADDLAVIDLLEVGLVDDDSSINDAGRLVLERLKADAPELPEGPRVPISTGAMIHQARAAAEHSFIDLDAPLVLWVRVKGKSYLLNVLGTKPNGDSLQLEAEVIE
jgi:hypothetical protein